MPVDCRTLLKTKRGCVNIETVSPGQYFHFGLKEILMKKIRPEHSNVLELVIGIDGLPISNSSKSQFWPILGFIKPDKNDVFMIGLYWGNEKPDDSNEFLRKFVDEVVDLQKTGLEFNNSTYLVVISSFAVDAVAKSFILKTKGHTAYSSCTKCTAKGEYVSRRVSFPIKVSKVRSHEDFVSKIDSHYHLDSEMSILLEIPTLDIVNDFPLDYMHLILIGVTRKLLNLLIHKSPYNLRMSKKKVEIANQRLCLFAKLIPQDFCRKCRDFSEVKRWKATELRLFLVYIGPSVFYNLLGEKQYGNFLLLSMGCYILLNEDLKDLALVAKLCFQMFVKSFSQIYGEYLISHYLHGLLHVYEDYKRFGCLDEYSCFPFENFLFKLKNTLRKSDKPLQQVVKRYYESLDSHGQNKTAMPETELKFFHNNGPVLSNYSIKNQYSSCKLKGVVLKTYFCSKKDCYILTKNLEVVQIRNIAVNSDGDIVIFGLYFGSKKDFWKVSNIGSSRLNIYEVNELSTDLKVWTQSELFKKCLVLPFSQKKVAIPIMHTHLN